MDRVYTSDSLVYLGACNMVWYKKNLLNNCQFKLLSTTWQRLKVFHCL